jgi:nicotinamidase-related amidase
MSSYPVRDQKKDHLITPENAALVIIDYQPVQVDSIGSMDKNVLVNNMVLLVRLAKIFKLPIVLSTVNIKTGMNKETIPELHSQLEGVTSYDRTAVNSWEDKEFYEAVQATGRKKLIMTALWTEACLTFPSLDAMKEGFEIYLMVDCVGGTSVTSHRTALRRLEQAGAKPTTLAQLACELQRDWNRHDTAGEFVKFMEAARLFPS